MKTKKKITTAYNLPFEVKYSPAPLFSSGHTVNLKMKVLDQVNSNKNLLTDVIRLFTDLAATGALAGSSVTPWNSGFQLDQSSSKNLYFKLQDCCLDEQAIIVLSHLLLAKQEDIMLKSIEIYRCENRPTIKLGYDPVELSTYPEVYPNLPFNVINEEPESGSYTFIIELKKPLQTKYKIYLENNLNIWVEAILAGGYGLAPIPPQESYIEPDDKHITTYDSTIEWAVFKVEANPACIECLINIFGAFHYRCQEIVSLTIM